VPQFLFLLLLFLPLDPGLTKALDAHKAGNMEEAVREYRAFLVTKPGSVEARSNLGAALARLGRYDEAVAEYKAALKLTPSQPGVSLNLALAYYKQGGFSAAARELSALRALLADAFPAQAALLLADSWLQLGENERVIKLLEPAAAQSPGDLAIAYALGTALAREKRIEEGQRYLDKILRHGESAEAHLLMGTALMNAVDYAAALKEFEKAVALNPQLPAANGFHGLVLMATGDSLAAARAFEAELALNPNDFQANLNLAVIRKQDQQYDDANRFLARALRVRPGDFGVRFQQAAILVAQNKTEPARVELESLVKQAPKFTEAHVALATVYYRLKRKADGDRERALVQQLNAEAQARQPKGEREASRN
jgi:tetratricopeptide (TPR) repeat protein